MKTDFGLWKYFPNRLASLTTTTCGFKGRKPLEKWREKYFNFGLRGISPIKLCLDYFQLKSSHPVPHLTCESTINSENLSHNSTSHDFLAERRPSQIQTKFRFTKCKQNNLSLIRVGKQWICASQTNRITSWFNNFIQFISFTWRLKHFKHKMCKLLISRWRSSTQSYNWGSPMFVTKTECFCVLLVSFNTSNAMRLAMTELCFQITWRTRR